MNAMTQANLLYEAKSRVHNHAAGSAGLGVLIVLILLGLLHEQIAPYAVGAGGTGAALAAPSTLHPFGTDVLGRDLWSETVHGLRVTLASAVAAFLIALAAGIFAGRAAVYGPGLFGAALRVVVNVLASIPSVLLAILLVGLMGPEHFLMASGIALIPAAFVESFDHAQGHRQAAYVEYARASGVTNAALLRRDLVHWFRASLLKDAAMLFATAIIVVSTVSFFGFGALPPARDLGLVIASAAGDLPEAWWAVAGPASFLVVLIMAIRAAGGLNIGDRG